MADKRTVRTLSAIRKAFCELLVEQGDVKFSVKEITGRANINRKTFYLHYKSVYDLYVDLENYTEDLLMEQLNSKGFFENKSLTVFISSLIDVFETNEKLYIRMLEETQYRFALKNIKKLMMEKVLSQFINATGIQYELQAEFLFAGLFRMFKIWTENKKEMCKEELILLAYSTIKNGINIVK